METLHYHFDTLPSTNDFAKERLAAFPENTLVVISADAQSAGRGQFGRVWVSPAQANLYVSFCFLASKGGDSFFLTRLMASSLQKVLKKHRVDADIKWPNDLIVNGKKIAGILTETVPLRNLVGIVIGVGLNVNGDSDFLATIDQAATSLFVEKRKVFSRNEILQSLEKEFLKKYREL